MECLDCPDPTVAAPRRSQTITPLQALSLLNNGFMEACASDAPSASAVKRGATPARSRRGLSIDTTARSERTRAARSTESFAATYGLEQFCLTLLNANEFLYID